MLQAMACSQLPALELLILYFGGSACVALNGPGRFSLDFLIIRAIGMGSSPLKAFVMRRPQLDELEDLVAVPVTTNDKY